MLPVTAFFGLQTLVGTIAMMGAYSGLIARKRWAAPWLVARQLCAFGAVGVALFENIKTQETKLGKVS